MATHASACALTKTAGAPESGSDADKLAREDRSCRCPLGPPASRCREWSWVRSIARTHVTRHCSAPPECTFALPSRGCWGTRGGCTGPTAMSTARARLCIGHAQGCRSGRLGQSPAACLRHSLPRCSACRVRPVECPALSGLAVHRPFHEPRTPPPSKHPRRLGHSGGVRRSTSVRRARGAGGSLRGCCRGTDAVCLPWL